MAVERAKQITMAELNAVMQVRREGAPGCNPRNVLVSWLVGRPTDRPSRVRSFRLCRHMYWQRFPPSSLPIPVSISAQPSTDGRTDDDDGDAGYWQRARQGRNALWACCGRSTIRPSVLKWKGKGRERREEWRGRMSCPSEKDFSTRSPNACVRPMSCNIKGIGQDTSG